jgi:bifunctional non-homologous end joining protein LigD
VVPLREISSGDGSVILSRTIESRVASHMVDRQAKRPAKTTGVAVPAFHPPLAAIAVNALPKGSGWIYEVKLDGYRARIIKDGRQIQVRSRNDKDLSYSAVVAAAGKIRAQQAIVDGEIVAIDEHGRPSFQALQHRGSHPKHRIVFYAFDLLHLDGQSLVAEPLQKRRALLPEVLKNSGLLLSTELPGSVADIVRTVQAMGLEGVIAKRKDSPYIQNDRSPHWRSQHRCRPSAGEQR